VDLLVQLILAEECAMFEAIHGSAPRRAGQNCTPANHGLIEGATTILDKPITEKFKNALAQTLKMVSTLMILEEGVSKQKWEQRIMGGYCHFG
jgi:isocitrate dehydrogenase